MPKTFFISSKHTVLKFVRTERKMSKKTKDFRPMWDKSFITERYTGC